MLYLVVVLSAIGVILMFATRTGPSEASSKLSEWISWLGFRPPRWLAEPAADHWSKRIGFLLLVVASILIVAWYYGNAQTSVPRNDGINCSFPGGSNSGNVICGNTFNLGGAPAQLEARKIGERREADGSIVSEISATLITDRTPSIISLEVSAQQITDIKACQFSPVTSMGTCHGGRAYPNKNMGTVRYPTPNLAWPIMLEVHTKSEPGTLSIRFGL
jgi:hypothetical protein